MKAYIKQIFDSVSPASFGRHSCFAVLVWIVIAATSVMINQWSWGKPMEIPDIPMHWYLLAVTLFGITAGKEAVSTFSTSKGGQ